MDFFSLDVASLEGLVLFLAPGFVFMYLFFYQIPDRKKSELTTVFIGVLASLALKYIAIGCFYLVIWITALNLPLPESNSIFLWFVTLYISIVLSIALGKFVRTELFRKMSKMIFGVNNFPFGRVWNDFFNVNSITVLRVYLQDGTSYIGKLDRVSVDPSDEIQELTLLDPNYFELKNGNPTVERIKEVSTVLLQGKSIKSIEKINYEDARDLYNLP